MEVTGTDTFGQQKTLTHSDGPAAIVLDMTQQPQAVVQFYISAGDKFIGVPGQSVSVENTNETPFPHAMKVEDGKDVAVYTFDGNGHFVVDGRAPISIDQFTPPPTLGVITVLAVA